jgi:nucleotide-binding universal stress UspA family protein
MKNILVATDFSNDAYAALFYISKLMASKPCTFYILNVYDEFTSLDGKKSPFLGDKELLPQIKIEAKEKLDAVIRKITLDTNNPKHSFQIILKKGIVAKMVSNTIEENAIDLVVMGTKGNTGTKEIFMGSNTIKVANALTLCPILAVPRQSDFKTPKEIAFVTDFKKGCSIKTIAPFLFIASLSNAAIRVMHINEVAILDAEQQLKIKLLEHCLKDFKHSFHWMQNISDKAQVIDTFLEKSTIDMFGMVHHKHSFFEKLLREPVLKDVSIYADIPLLILPYQD